MIKSALAASFLVLAALPAYADGPDVVAEMALKAIDKGYGATCSLEMKPVRRNGYYPCLDFGPYRFVKGYGKVYGLVVQKDKEPFLVMSGPEGRPAWLYDGPWQTDMPSRVVMFWNDTVEGGATKRGQEEAASAEKQAAAEYIRKLNGEDKPEKPAAAAPSAAAAKPEPKAEAMAPDARAILSSD